MQYVAGALTVRPPRPEDAPGLVAAVQGSLAELAPWMPWATPAYDEDLVRRWMRGEMGPGHEFLLLEGGEVVGSCGLNAIDEANGRANLGYWVRSDRTGGGRATTAALLVARHGVRHCGLHRFEIVMSTRNEASRRVAERVGARHEGVARGRLLLHGERHDAHVYGLLAGDAALAVDGEATSRR